MIPAAECALGMAIGIGVGAALAAAIARWAWERWVRSQ